MPFTNGHALIIGVGADLPITVDDAKGLDEIVRDPERCAYPREQVQLLTHMLATRDDILAGLERLAQMTDEHSTVIVFFSGHGYRVSSTMGAAYYLMPYGYDLQSLYQTAISGSEFAARLRAIPAQKLLLLLDCCHAGGVGEAKGLELAKAPLPPEAEQLLAEGSGRVVIASSREDERSFTGRPYSAFTLALIESLCGVGVAKQDGYVRVADLALHTREVVPGRTNAKQHPILHFEQADNFALAFYAGGEKAPRELPFTGEPEIEPEPGAWAQQRLQQTASGSRAVNIGGSASHSPIITGDNNTVIHSGRDSIQAGGNVTQVAGDYIRGSAQAHGPTSSEKARVRAFAQVYTAIRARPPSPDVDADEITARVKEIEQEARKGEQANERKLTRWLCNLAEIAEDIFVLTAAALSEPQAAFASVARRAAAQATQQHNQG